MEVEAGIVGAVGHSGCFFSGHDGDEFLCPVDLLYDKILSWVDDKLYAPVSSNCLSDEKSEESFGRLTDCNNLSVDGDVVSGNSNDKRRCFDGFTGSVHSSKVDDKPLSVDRPNVSANSFSLDSVVCLNEAGSPSFKKQSVFCAHDLHCQGDDCTVNLLNKPCKSAAVMPYVHCATNSKASVRCNSHRSAKVILARGRKQTPTFGVGRKGLLDPIRKGSSSGPGLYFVSNKAFVGSNVCADGGHHDGKNFLQHCNAKNEGDSLRRGFESLCKCYWNQFKEVEMPTNPFAHAKNCPCQLIDKVTFMGNAHQSGSNFVPDTKQQGSEHPCKVASAVSTLRHEGVDVKKQEKIYSFRESGFDHPSSAADVGKRDNNVQSGSRSAALSKTQQTRRQANAAPLSGTSAFDAAALSGASSIKKNCKGVSFGKAPRQFHVFTDVPGPGTYNIEATTVRGGSVKRNCFFTTSPRKLQLVPTSEEESHPGPGEYCIEDGMRFDARCKTAPAFSFGRAKLLRCANTVSGTCLVEDSDLVPGPGAYTITNNERGPAYSLRSRPTEKIEITPGPGHYEVRTEMAGPRWTLSARRPCFVKQEPTPGPGDYFVPIYDLRRTHSKASFFSLAPRLFYEEASKVAMFPGPGAYDVKVVTNAARSIVMGSAQRQLQFKLSAGDDVPGPGAYTLLHTTQDKHVGTPFLASTAPRFDNNDGGGALRDCIPGPGSYDVDPGPTLSEKRSTIFGSAPRDLLATNKCGTDENVGPGAYDVAMPVKGGAVVFGTSPRLFHSEFTAGDSNLGSGLGPGSYDPQVAKGNMIGAAWSTAPRFAPEEHNDVPGPGSYLSHSSPGCGVRAAFFGSSSQHEVLPEEREILMRRGVGPGSYEVAPQESHAFHATFGTAPTRRDALPELTPGPGQYTPSDPNVLQPRVIVFGSASRVPLVPNSDDVPGPGAYAPTSAATVGGAPVGPVSFSNAPRFGHADKLAWYGNSSDTPGPASYMVNGGGEKIGGAGAAVFGTEPRFFDSEQNDRAMLPGPGQYQPFGDGNAVKASVAYSFGKEPRAGGKSGDARSEVPGPGAYEVTTSDMKCGPSYRFSTAPRVLHADDADKPGPGYYDYSNLIDGVWLSAVGAQSFTKGVRFAAQKDADASVPGPGQYSPHDPKWDASKVHSFPTSGRELLSKSADVPGPGAYNAVVLESAPAVFFGTSERATCYDTHDASVPGPGAYDVELKTQAGPVYSLHRTAPRELVLTNMEKSQFPGPGAYTLPPAFPAAEAQGASVSFPKAAYNNCYGVGFSDLKQDVPGPGFYDPRLPQSTAGLTIGRAPRFTELGNTTGGGKGGADVPGPGHYDVDLKDHCASTRVDGGVALRFTASRFPTGDDAGAFQTPGPGSYSPAEPLRQTGGVLFFSAPRFALTENKDAQGGPGPGEYDLPPAWRPSDGAGYSFGTSMRIENTARVEDSPGPGTYDPSSYASKYLTGPAFTMQGKPRFHESSSTAECPGPCDYFPRSVETARTTTFAPLPAVDKDLLFEARVNATPGPAAYYLPETLEKRAVTIGTAPRAVEKTEEVPGPGAYLTGGPVVLPSQPAFSFGTAPRPDVVPHGLHDVPGPGEYYHPMEQGQSAPTFTFANAERFGNVERPITHGLGEAYHPFDANLSRGPVFSFAPALQAEKTAMREANTKMMNDIGPWTCYQQSSGSGLAPPPRRGLH